MLKKENAPNSYLSLENLVDRLSKDQLRKKDVIVPNTCLAMNEGKLVVTGMPDDYLKDFLKGTGITSSSSKTVALDVLEICDEQIAEKLNIPAKYYQRMRTQAR